MLFLSVYRLIVVVSLVLQRRCMYAAVVTDVYVPVDGRTKVFVTTFSRMPCSSQLNVSIEIGFIGGGFPAVGRFGTVYGGNGSEQTEAVRKNPVALDDGHVDSRLS